MTVCPRFMTLLSRPTCGSLVARCAWVAMAVLCLTISPVGRAQDDVVVESPRRSRGMARSGFRQESLPPPKEKRGTSFPDDPPTDADEPPVLSPAPRRPAATIEEYAPDDDAIVEDNGDQYDEEVQGDEAPWGGDDCEEDYVEAAPRPRRSRPRPARAGHMGRMGPGMGHPPLLPSPRKLRFHAQPMFAHNDPSDPSRHRGYGVPLRTGSWRNRPLYLSGFVGGLIGDEIIENQIRQGGGFLAGARFGGDFDHYFGLEGRLAFSDLSLSYPRVVANGRSSHVSYLDAALLWYPLGDSRWRPYWLTGVGVGTFAYRTAAGQEIRASTATLPFGVGLKIRMAPQWALRFEVIDNFSFGSSRLLDSMHNVGFTAGAEWRFGGRRMSFDPW